MTIPIGAIVHYSQIHAPENPDEPWFACNGRLLPRDGHEPLFEVIGGAFGDGDEVSNFALPDLRGYFVRGVNVSPNLGIPDVPARGPELEGAEREAMDEGGNTGEKVGSVQGGALFGHCHDIKTTTFSGGAAVADFAVKDVKSDEGEAGATGRFAKGKETRPINAAFSYMILAGKSKQHFPLYGIIGYGGSQDPPATEDGEEWKICDGRTVDSDLIGSVSLPDLRGWFLRCMDDCGGRGSADRDPEALTTRYGPGTQQRSAGMGSVQEHEFGAHSHALGGATMVESSDLEPLAEAKPGPDPVGSTGVTGVKETRPINACLHYIMRVA